MGRETALRPAEWLTALGREYHHLQQEHQREQPAGATRRKQRARMARLIERFERLLAHWVHDEALAARWREHLHRSAPAPGEPALAQPPRFRGRTASGALIELRAGVDDGYDIYMDGAKIDREPWHLDPEEIPPVRIAGEVCTELFQSSEEARNALARFAAREAGEEPPWHHAAELFEDGLIDADFALTDRGRRCLSRVAARAAAGNLLGGHRFCVLVANGARARLLTLDAAEPPDQPTLSPLVEVADYSSQKGRARDRDLVSNTRPGLRAESYPRLSQNGARSVAVSGHAVDDRREARRREAERAFADGLAEQAVRACRSLGDCELIVVAPPAMLGFLRPAIERRFAPTAGSVRELARDLTRTATAALHDALATAALLPARGRRPPAPSVWATTTR